MLEHLEKANVVYESFMWKLPTGWRTGDIDLRLEMFGWFKLCRYEVMQYMKIRVLAFKFNFDIDIKYKLKYMQIDTT